MIEFHVDVMDSPMIQGHVEQQNQEIQQLQGIIKCMDKLFLHACRHVPKNPEIQSKEVNMSVQA